MMRTLGGRQWTLGEVGYHYRFGDGAIMDGTATGRRFGQDPSRFKPIQAILKKTGK